MNPPTEYKQNKEVSQKTEIGHFEALSCFYEMTAHRALKFGCTIIQNR